MRSSHAFSVRGFGSLALVSALLGVVAAFVLLPIVGAAGLAAKAAASSFDNLPTDLKTPAPPERSVILAADGSYISSFYSENRITVRLKDVPQVTRHAVIAIEDSRFYEHNGVDIRGIVRALIRNQEAGQIRQGASTLTQQYVKQVLLEQAVARGDKQAAEAAVAKSKERKLREIRYALALEKRLSKDEILERYLNITYFGGGAYGIGTASELYFSKPINKVNLAESALLAGLVQSPSDYDPVQHKDAAIHRRNVVLARMAELGFVSKEDADKAEKEPIELHVSAVPNGCVNARISGQFCDYVRRYLLDSPEFGATREARQARLFKGGLTITTTLQPRLQALAQAAVDKSFPTGSRYVSGLASIEPTTGRVKALAVSRPFQSDQNPYLTYSRFQTGSTAKAFVLTAALLKGLPLTTRIYSPHDYTSHVLVDYKDGRKVGYHVANDSPGMVGNYDMRSGIAASVNTYYVQLEERVGVDNGVRAALALGISNPVIDAKTGEREFDRFLKYPAGYGSFTLGAAEISPLDMANAYATLAAQGVECSPTPIEWVTDANGERLNVGARHCHQAIDKGVAAAATEALTWVVNPKGSVTNGNTGGGANIGRPVAGKTGTTQDIKEAWFVGYAPQLAAAAVVFDPTHKTTLPGGDRSNRISVRAWARFMKPALDGTPVVQFPSIDPKFLRGGESNQPRVPNVAGLTVNAAVSILSNAGFQVQMSTTPVAAGPIPAGRVAWTSPSGGTPAAPGSMVTLFVSNGELEGVGQSPPPATPAPLPPPPKRRCKPPFCRPWG